MKAILIGILLSSWTLAAQVPGPIAAEAARLGIYVGQTPRPAPVAPTFTLIGTRYGAVHTTYYQTYGSRIVTTYGADGAIRSHVLLGTDGLEIVSTPKLPPPPMKRKEK